MLGGIATDVFAANPVTAQTPLIRSGTAPLWEAHNHCRY
jgi:hypothetical protein